MSDRPEQTGLSAGVRWSIGGLAAVLVACGLGGDAYAVPRVHRQSCQMRWGWPGLRIDAGRDRHDWLMPGRVVTAGKNPRPPVTGSLKKVAFGKLDTLYHVGKWVVFFPSKSSRHLYVWYGKRARMVLEIVRNANGWLRWRKGTHEMIIWSDGTTSAQKLDARPWTKSLSGLTRSSTSVGSRVVIKGSNGTTTFEIIKAGLNIKLPDKGVLTLKRNKTAFTLLLYNRTKTVTFQ